MSGKDESVTSKNSLMGTKSGKKNYETGLIQVQGIQAI